jgi:hypothetical protein
MPVILPEGDHAKWLGEDKHYQKGSDSSLA